MCEPRSLGGQGNGAAPLQKFLRLAVLVVTALCFSTFAFAQSPAPMTVDKELRFSASFPITPRVESIVYTNRSGDSLPARRFSAAMGGEFFAVTVAEASRDYPIDLNLLEHAADELRRRGDVKIQADDNYDPGIPGRQFDIMQPDGRQLRAFVYMQDYKLYVVESIGAPGTLPTFMFAESFTLLDAEGKEINLSP
jgi:hypothetical protein